MPRAEGCHVKNMKRKSKDNRKKDNLSLILMRLGLPPTILHLACACPHKSRCTCLENAAMTEAMAFAKLSAVLSL